ncbi:MAG: hypothetical protein ACTSP3_03255 [Candidatus Heimdallarchaeaceae archaeon]
MLYQNFIKRNKKFLITQFPQFTILFFLLVLSLIISANNDDRLNSFATEKIPFDLSGSIYMHNNDELVLIPEWENELTLSLSTKIETWNSGVLFSITYLNSKTSLLSSEVATSIGVIATSSFLSIPENETYLYGNLFLDSGFEKGNNIDINTTIVYESKKYTSNLTLQIKGYLDFLPTFFENEVNQISNFIVISSSHLKSYFETLPLSVLGIQVTYIFGCRFAVNFKKDFSIPKMLNDFIYFSSNLLNETYSGMVIEPPQIIWSLEGFLSRIENLRLTIQKDLLFYCLASFPIFLIMIVFIYQLKDKNFQVSKNFIKILDARGYSQKKISFFFFKLYLLFYFILSILASFVVVTISYILRFNIYNSIIQSIVFISIWLIINLSFQYITFKSELVRLHSPKNRLFEVKRNRSSWKFVLMRFLFIFIPYSLVSLIFYLLSIVFYFPQSFYFWFFTLYIISGIILFLQYFEKLLVFLIQALSFITITQCASKIFKDTGKILHRLFFSKNKTKTFEYSSLLIMFLLAPSIFMLSDSYHYFIKKQQYNSVCGDVLIENVRPEVYNFLANSTQPSNFLPILKWKTISNITYFFSFPRLFADFANYTWLKGNPYTSPDYNVLDKLCKLQNKFLNIIISQELSEKNGIFVGDNLTLHMNSQDSLIISPLNISSINYTVSNVLETLPYISAITDEWVFANLVLDENSSIYFRNLLHNLIKSLIFNRSLIDIVMLKLDSTNQAFLLKKELIEVYPYLDIKILEDKEYINQKYPVPYLRFQQLINLELAISMIMLIIFFIQVSIFTINQKKQSIFQLFIKGIPLQHLFLSFTIIVLILFIVCFALGFPFALLLTKGLLKLLSLQQEGVKIPISLSSISANFLVTFVLLALIFIITAGYLQFNRTIKKAEKFLGEQYE